MSLKTLFPNPKPIIGMIHVGALPGTPSARAGVGELTANALREARIYHTNGVDGLMLENMHDVPYLRGAVGPEVTAALALIAHAVKTAHQLPTGLQILAAANREALAVAHAAGLNFIRAEGYAFAHVADEGIIEACAGPLLRYRRHIGAERVQIWADVKKKHSAHALTADVSLGETVEAVEFMRGDAVIVTGRATGAAPTPDELREAKKYSSLPVLLGSGVDAGNMRDFFPLADGLIVGSHFKREGHWRNTVDTARVARFMDEVRRLRENAS